MNDYQELLINLGFGVRAGLVPVYTISRVLAPFGHKPCCLTLYALVEAPGPRHIAMPPACACAHASEGVRVGGGRWE